MSTDPLRRSIRSYVLRSKALSPARARVFATHWQQFGLELAEGRQAFLRAFPGAGPRLLDIGFGMGDALLEFALANPHMACFGVEVHLPGVACLVQSTSETGADNIRIYREDILAVLEQCVPEASLMRVNVFFPDPWPKKRHHKRRLIDDVFLDMIGARLLPHGLLHIATDWQPYAEAVAGLLHERDDFQSMPIPPRPQTKYERRGLQLGHRITDLCFGRLP